MSFANSLKKIASEFNAGLRIFKRNIGLKSTCSGAAFDALKSTEISHLTLPLSATLDKSKIEKFCITFPQADIKIKKNIIEPEKNIKIKFELPIRSSTDTVLEFPFHIEKEIKEPPIGKVISKRATHLIIIRRRKMKKHKHKKYLKKHKVEIETKRMRRKMEKEANFQHSLKNILSEIDTYSAENYVKETLEKVNWQRPVTRIKGYLCPKWVVKQCLEEREQKRIIKKRIEECMK